MRKALCFLCVLTVAISFLCACGKEKNATSSNEKTSVNLDSEYDLGNEYMTTVIDSGNEKQVVHIDENGKDIMIEHCKENGGIYVEKPVYDENGEIKGYKYYDLNNNYLAGCDTYNSFYDKDGKFITEDDFEKIIDELG